MGANGKKYRDVQIRLTGNTGEIDGVMEMLVGMFVMSGVMLSVRKSVLSDGKGQSKIYLEIQILPPPLGNLGEDDLPEYRGNNP